jgi:hypothetical protein
MGGLVPPRENEMAFNPNRNAIIREAEYLKKDYWRFRLALLKLPYLNPHYPDTQVDELVRLIEAVNKKTRLEIRKKRLQELRQLPVRHAERALWYKTGDGRKGKDQTGSVPKYGLSLSAAPRKRRFRYI